MSVRAPFKRLILRAVLRNVSPMVIRIIAVPDSLHLHEFVEAFRAVLGWDNIGFLFHIHGQEFNSFRRATRPRTLCEFQLRPTETFSTPPAPSICGNGRSGSWTKNPDHPSAMIRRCVWAVAAPCHHSIAAVPQDTG